MHSTEPAKGSSKTRIHDRPVIHAITVSMMRTAEDAAVKEYGIPEMVMMENASRAVAVEALSVIKQKAVSRVIILCGGGNNGGDGLACARHLYNHTMIEPLILLCKGKQAFTGSARMQYDIISKMSLPVIETDLPLNQFTEDTLVIDAIFGTGLKGTISGTIKTIIDSVNTSPATVVAIDIPSGLDADTGDTYGSAVHADITVTMGAPKTGMLKPLAQQFVGRMIVADIGIPRRLLIK